jgi:hypothetical protein
LQHFLDGIPRTVDELSHGSVLLVNCYSPMIPEDPQSLPFFVQDIAFCGLSCRLEKDPSIIDFEGPVMNISALIS